MQLYKSVFNSFVYRAPAIIASLFPNLKLSYRSSLGKFNSIGNDLLITLRASNVSLKCCLSADI